MSQLSAEGYYNSFKEEIDNLRDSGSRVLQLYISHLVRDIEILQAVTESEVKKLRSEYAETMEGVESEKVRRLEARCKSLRIEVDDRNSLLYFYREEFGGLDRVKKEVEKKRVKVKADSIIEMLNDEAVKTVVSSLVASKSNLEIIIKRLSKKSQK